MEDSFFDRLKQLDVRRKLIYGYWVSGRLLHNYIDFHNQAGFGNIDVLLDAMSLLRKCILGEKPNLLEIEMTLEKIDLNTPHTEDFDSIRVSFALNACNAISESLNYSIDFDDQRIVDIISFSIDTVDMFIQEKENFLGSDIEEKISNDNFMIREIASQLRFLEYLESDTFKLGEIEFDRNIDLNII